MAAYLPPQHSCHREHKWIDPARDEHYLQHSLQVIEDALSQSPTGFIDVLLRPASSGSSSTSSAEEKQRDLFTLVDVFVFHEIAQLHILVPNTEDNGNLQGHQHIMTWLDKMYKTPFADVQLDALRNLRAKQDAKEEQEANND